MGRKHCEKRRNCSLRAISPLLTVFSKDLYCRHLKARAKSQVTFSLGKSQVTFSDRSRFLHCQGHFHLSEQHFTHWYWILLVCYVRDEKIQPLLSGWLDFLFTLSQTSPGLVQVCWKHCGKRRNCSSQAISPFPPVFSTRLESFLPFSRNVKLSSANSLSFEESKICRLGKG